MKHLKERNEIIRIAREISKSGLVAGTWGNVSQRVALDSCMAITPSGMDYWALEAEDIVIVDINGEMRDGQYKPSIETPLHLAIYKKRPDVQAIVHVHSTFATVFAVAGKSIPVVLEETAQVIGHEIRVAPYAECGTNELAEMVAGTLGSEGNVVLLANHGVVATGRDLNEALTVCRVTEKTAQIVLWASLLGKVNALEPGQVKLIHESFKGYGQKKRG
ncbi:MAG: class II aldolase/adducin family protein [Syntrophomonadaceae bacterium]|jgi:L-fuculose-phosphate aldolase